MRARVESDDLACGASGRGSEGRRTRASGRREDGGAIGGAGATRRRDETTVRRSAAAIRRKRERAFPRAGSRAERARTEFPGTSDESTLHSEVRAGRIARDTVREPREGARESELQRSGAFGGKSAQVTRQQQIHVCRLDRRVCPVCAGIESIGQIPGVVDPEHPSAEPRPGKYRPARCVECDPLVPAAHTRTRRTHRGPSPWAPAPRDRAR